MADDKWGYGDPKDNKPFGITFMGPRERPRAIALLMGEHPHSRSDNRIYAQDASGTIHEFDGYRTLIDFEIRSNNYLKESHLSGDEIRKGGSAKILADGVVVFEFFFRDPMWALLRAHQVVGELSEHSSGWLVATERERLVGRKIWYERTPAIIERLIVDQGCILIKPDGVPEFPPPVWADKDDADDEDRHSIKTSVTDARIWWFRDMEYNFKRT